MKKTAVIIGAGKGLGNHIATEFANHDFKVILVARNIVNLNMYKNDFEKQGIDVDIYSADVSDKVSLHQAISTIKQVSGEPDVVIYNAALVAPDSEKFNRDELTNHLTVDVLGAMQVIDEVVSDEFAAKKGSILFMGGYVALDPNANFIGLSTAKAGLRALAKSAHDLLEPRGIFVGHLVPGEFAELTPGSKFDPAHIANSFWEMYTSRENWELVFNAK